MSDYDEDTFEEEGSSSMFTVIIISAVAVVAVAAAVIIACCCCCKGEDEEMTCQKWADKDKAVCGTVGVIEKANEKKCLDEAPSTDASAKAPAKTLCNVALCCKPAPSTTTSPPANTNGTSTGPDTNPTGPTGAAPHQWLQASAGSLEHQLQQTPLFSAYVRMAEEGLKKREAEVRDLIDYDQKVAATSAYNPEGGAGAKPMDELMTNKIFYTLLKNAGDFATVAGPDEAIKKAEALATMPECEDVADPSAVRNDATWVDWYVKEKKGKDPNADGDKERDAEVAARGNELKDVWKAKYKLMYQAAAVVFSLLIKTVTIDRLIADATGATTSLVTARGNIAAKWNVELPVKNASNFQKVTADTDVVTANSPDSDQLSLLCAFPLSNSKIKDVGVRFNLAAVTKVCGDMFNLASSWKKDLSDPSKPELSKDATTWIGHFRTHLAITDPVLTHNTLFVLKRGWTELHGPNRFGQLVRDLVIVKVMHLLLAVNNSGKSVLSRLSQMPGKPETDKLLVKLPVNWQFSVPEVDGPQPDYVSVDSAGTKLLSLPVGRDTATRPAPKLKEFSLANVAELVDHLTDGNWAGLYFQDLEYLLLNWVKRSKLPRKDFDSFGQQSVHETYERTDDQTYRNVLQNVEETIVYTAKMSHTKWSDFKTTMVPALLTDKDLTDATNLVAKWDAATYRAEKKAYDNTPSGTSPFPDPPKTFENVHDELVDSSGEVLLGDFTAKAEKAFASL